MLLYEHNLNRVIRQVDIPTKKKRTDWEEVQNYVEAMNNAVILLDKLAFYSRNSKTYAFHFDDYTGISFFTAENNFLFLYFKLKK